MTTRASSCVDNGSSSQDLYTPHTLRSMYRLFLWNLLFKSRLTWNRLPFIDSNTSFPRHGHVQEARVGFPDSSSIEGRVSDGKVGIYDLVVPFFDLSLIQNSGVRSFVWQTGSSGKAPSQVLLLNKPSMTLEILSESRLQ